MTSTSDKPDRSDWFVWIWIIIVVIAVGGGYDQLTNHQPPNHTGDYTGVCNRPTSQMSC